MHLWWAREEAWGCRNGMRPQKWFLLWGGGLPRGGACPHVSGGLVYEGVFPPHFTDGWPRGTERLGDPPVVTQLLGTEGGITTPGHRLLSDFPVSVTPLS